MNDIKIINGHYVRTQKVFFHESEILLAKCFGFNIDLENMVVVADLKTTSKRSLFEFLKLSFKSFSESPLQEEERNRFYSQVQEVYDGIYAETEEIVKSKLSYYDNLYQHQKEGLIWNYNKRCVFLAYEQGLGKTISSASISKVHNARRTIIVCPASVKYNWFRDLKRFGFNELYFTMLDAAKSRTIKAFNERFVIVNYDILAKYEKELVSGGIDHFIFDEVHLCKNKGSARTKAVMKLIEQFPEARITMLSGTPVKNRVDDVYSYLKIIGHPLGANYKRFMDEYTIKSIGRFSKVTGGKNLQDLHIKLSNFMVRKTERECLDLPKRIYLSYTYQLDDYRSEYDSVIEQLSAQKEHSALSGNLHSLNIITARAKIKGICEIADDIIENGKKVVIFSGYRTPIAELEKYFGEKCVVVDGSIDAFTRDKNIQRFWNDDECQVFIGNTSAAGVGINLTNASDIIFTNFTFTPSEMWQCISRCHRIGQANSVKIHYTVCEDSIDEDLRDIIEDKAKDINALIDQNKDFSSMDGNVTEILISKLLKRDNNGETNIRVEPESDFLAVNETSDTAPKIRGIEIKKEENSIPDFLMD